VPKFINILLAIAILVSAALFVRTNQKRSSLESEYDRLAADYGELDVEDEDQFMVTFVPGEYSRRQFTWRIYKPLLPNGLKDLVNSSSGSSSSTDAPGEAREFRAFARFRIEDGNPEFYFNNDGHSSARQFRRNIRKFVTENWDEFEFEIMAESEPMVVSKSEVLRVFAIRIPEHLHNDLPEELSDRMRKQYTTEPLVEFIIGDSGLF